MTEPVHITSGDSAGGSLAEAGLPGEVFVWHDILYDGPPRAEGWPDDEMLTARAAFLEQVTAGGLDGAFVLQTLQRQYRKLTETARDDRGIVLWFDACLFDQAMLAHVLMCLRHLDARRTELLCVDAFPGVEPYHGLGQLQPHQLASVYDRRQPVTAAQFDFAARVDAAFATQDVEALTALAQAHAPPLPWIPAAVGRWLEERPDPVTGLGRLETLALAAVHDGCRTPAAIFAAVAAAEPPPQYWGDTTLWARINSLAERHPPLVTIDGPAHRLPQWDSQLPLHEFTVKPVRKRS